MLDRLPGAIAVGHGMGDGYNTNLALTRWRCDFPDHEWDSAFRKALEAFLKIHAGRQHRLPQIADLIQATP